MLKKIITVLFIAILVMPPALPLKNVQAEVAPSAAYGYTIEKEASAVGWIELESDPGAIIFSGGEDDRLSDQVDILFTFPFFEFQYSNVRISSNGFISFDPTINNAYMSNSQLLMDAAPNNIIAAFWDDLKLSTQVGNIGKVLAKTDTTSGKKFIVEWVNVTLLGSAALLKFEIILYESGKIELVYKEINGDVSQNTIGIEDSDGVDGIEAFCNGSGFAGIITSDMTLRFTYPPESYRVKAFPAFQSKFVEQKEVIFLVNARNTSASFSDTFQLTNELLEGDAGWTLKFLDAQTQIQITGTGSMVKGATKPFLVKLTPPPGAMAGSYVKQKVKIQSAADATKSFSVIFQAGIAAPFMQVFSDFLVRINLNTITSKEQALYRVSDSYDYGYSLTIKQLDPNDYRYLTTWQEIKGGITNIQYTLSHAIRGSQSQILMLENNEGKLYSPRDKAPDIDVIHPQGITGFVFLRELTEPSSGGVNINVYFSRVSSAGVQSGTPVEITDSTGFGFGYTADFPMFRTPKIAAISSQFGIVWERYYVDTGAKSYSDIYFCAYSSTGNLLKSPTSLTTSTEFVSYKDPAIMKFGTDKIFSTYFSRNSDPSTPIDKRDELWLKILDINGNPIGAPIRIGYYYGQSVDMVQLGNRMVMAWINNTTNRINYAILDENGALQGTVKEFVSPDKRNMANFSITKDPSGTKAIFTWENNQKDSLYYAMINTSIVITPPMIFRQGEGTNPVIRTGASGGSNAPMKNFTLSKTFLPFMGK